MEALLKPDTGLIFWTVINFLILSFLLAKFAWKPIVSALDEREKNINDEIESAKAANGEALKIKAEIETRLDTLSKESAAKMKEAADAGEQERQRILADAASRAAALLEAARAQIKADTGKAVEELKKEAVNITMLAVKKIIGKEADQKTSAKMVEEFLENMKTK
jgi:F-type H+-transporting ATPase subunit b